MNKLFVRILITTLVAFGLFIYLYFSETGRFPDIIQNLDILLWYMFTWNVVGWVLLKISERLDKVLSWKSGVGKRYLAGFISYLAIGNLLMGLFGLIYLLFPNDQITPLEYFRGNSDTILKLIITTGFLLFIYTLIDFSYYSYRQYAFEHIEAMRIKRDQLNLQFNALKKQLSPHFLFNSLNTASSLLYRDQAKSEQYIRKLANSYKTILKSVNHSLITLAEELNIVSDYKYIMEIRFEKSLTIDIDIPEKYLGTKIPTLCLQLLVENAIKHNMISDTKPLKVEIYINNQDYIVVANNYNEKPFFVNVNDNLIENPENRTTKIGLENIKKRYAFYTGRKVTIEKSPESFTVGLPILAEKINEG